MAKPPTNREKSNRGAKLCGTIKEALYADSQLWNISSVLHFTSPTVPEPARKDKLKPLKPKRQTAVRPKSKNATNVPIIPSTRNASQCKLLQLPAKIRNKIWAEILRGHLFFGGSTVDLDLSNHRLCRSSNDFIVHSTEWRHKTWDILNFILTCRQA
jgi:hypothetical protein